MEQLLPTLKQATNGCKFSNTSKNPIRIEERLSFFSKDYDLKDAYNADETGRFLELLPDFSLAPGLAM